MEHLNITALNAGTPVSGLYILSYIHSGISSKGEPYISGTLSDKSGQISFIAWNYQGALNMSNTGCVVNVFGNVSMHRGKLQIVCDSICKADTTSLSTDEYRCIIPHAPINVKDRQAMLYNFIESIDDLDLFLITKKLIDQNLQKFSAIPAAMDVHHAFINGLLMHTTDMVMMASDIADKYGDRINRSLLISGTILHDIGKVKEFSISSDTGLVSDYSLNGNAMGHSIIGIMMIEEAAKEVNADPIKTNLLQNMIASHHGRPEYGAVATAITLEAEILHSLDYVDTRVEIYTKNLVSVSFDSFSPWIKCLEKKVYKHSLGCQSDSLGDNSWSSPLKDSPGENKKKFPIGLSVEKYFDNYEYYSSL